MPRDRLRTLLTGAGLMLAALFVIAVLYVLSGFYNVAASKKHFDITTWFLEVVRTQSVWTHSLLIEAPEIEDENMVQLGAAHYAAGCAFCHGSPADEPSPLAAAMLPEPPSLETAAFEWTTEQLFWIVQHGQKYTGMPHWPFPEREDEVWSLVAFLKKLPEMRAEEYIELAGGGTGWLPGAPDLGHGFSGESDGISNCIRCHGKAGALPTSNLVPLLSGQAEGYLERALREYRAGRRPSGIMQVAATELSDAEIAAFAEYYGRAGPVAVPQPDSDTEAITRGAEIVGSGVPEQDVPPCISCHDASPDAVFPAISGQYRRYVEQQLLILKQGLRSHTGPAEIMSRVANRLTHAQIRDVAAYLQSVGSFGQPPEATNGEASAQRAQQ